VPTKASKDATGQTIEPNKTKLPTQPNSIPRPVITQHAAPSPSIASVQSAAPIDISITALLEYSQQPLACVWIWLAITIIVSPSKFQTRVTAVAYLNPVSSSPHPFSWDFPAAQKLKLLAVQRPQGQHRTQKKKLPLLQVLGYPNPTQSRTLRRIPSTPTGILAHTFLLLVLLLLVLTHVCDLTCASSLSQFRHIRAYPPRPAGLDNLQLLLPTPVLENPHQFQKGPGASAVELRSNATISRNEFTTPHDLTSKIKEGHHLPRTSCTSCTSHARPATPFHLAPVN